MTRLSTFESRTYGSRASKRGAALLLTLLVLAILVVLVVQLAFSVKVESRIVRNTEDDAAFEFAARGVPRILEALIADDRKNGVPPGDLDTLADLWCDPNLEEDRTFEMGDVSLELEVEDLERRLPLLWLADGDEDKAQLAQVALQRLIDKLKPIAEVDAAQTAELIAEQVRSINEGTGGAPGAPPVVPPPGQPQPGQTGQPRRFVGLDQLLEAPGLDRRVLYGDPEADPPTEGIAPYVTTWPVTQVNLNTALAPVLFALLPEKNLAEESLWEQADDIVLAIRKKRIDPQLIDEGGADVTQGESGASKSWPGAAFTKVEELETGELHPRLGTIFTPPPPPEGEEGQPPPPPQQPQPGEGQPPAEEGEAQGNDLYQGIYGTSSRFYMVKATMTVTQQDGEELDPADRPRGVIRLLLVRQAGGTELTPLFVKEAAQ